MPDPDLAGVTVLNTRPPQTAAELSRAVERRGGRVVAFPVLEIVPRDAAAVRQDADALPPADVTVFVSRNAAEFGFAHASGKVAAVGPATAAALESRGLDIGILPAGGFDSEHLLEEPALADPRGKVFRIIRGNAGRELLAEELSARGARVDYLPVYERRCPEYSAEQLSAIAARFNGGEVDAIVVMSVQSLFNLEALIPAICAEAYRRTPLVTPAVRVIKELDKRGPERRVALAVSPQPDDILDAIVNAARKPRRTE